jgi:type IV secretory pathway VirB10-like protein
MLALLLSAAAAPALAQYKCTAADGAITFQGTPCFGYAKEQKLEVRPNGTPIAVPRPASAASGAPPAPAVPAPSAASAPPPQGNVDKRMLAKYEEQRQREQLRKAVAAAQDEIARHAAQKAAELAATQKALGNGDPSAYAKALDTLTAHYRALDEIDGLRLASAQKALAEWEKGQR